MVKYLKIKNKIFKKIFMQLYKSGELREALYYLDGEDRYTDYYDLVGLYFRDEEGYQRSLFLPVPLLTGKMRKILFDSLGNYHIVSQELHALLISSRRSSMIAIMLEPHPVLNWIIFTTPWTFMNAACSKAAITFT